MAMLLQMFAKGAKSTALHFFRAGDGHLRLRAPAADRRPPRLPRGRVPLLVSGTELAIRVKEEIWTLQASNHHNVPMRCSAPDLSQGEVKGVADGRAAGCLN